MLGSCRCSSAMISKVLSAFACFMPMAKYIVISMVWRPRVSQTSVCVTFGAPLRWAPVSTRVAWLHTATHKKRKHKLILPTWRLTMRDWHVQSVVCQRLAGKKSLQNQWIFNTFQVRTLCVHHVMCENYKKHLCFLAILRSTTSCM